jgi:hypothetical protein
MTAFEGFWHRGTAWLIGALALVIVVASPHGPAAAQGEWRTYRDPTLGFRVLYPPKFQLHRIAPRPGQPGSGGFEWRTPDAPVTIRLGLIDKPVGLSLAEWVKRAHEGRIAESTVAGQPAFIQEGVFEGQLITDVWFADPLTGKVIHFTHTIGGLEGWMGQPLNRVKNRHRAELDDFWNMVESIQFAEE